MIDDDNDDDDDHYDGDDDDDDRCWPMLNCWQILLQYPPNFYVLMYMPPNIFCVVNWRSTWASISLLVASAASSQLANIALLIVCPSVFPSVCLKHNSGVGYTAKTTGPIYFIFFQYKIFSI